MKKRIDKTNRFMSFFDEQTGFYMRTGVINESGEDTGIDPFMSSYPELIDIGIMGKCIHGQTGLCLKSGVECYQDGLNKKMENMSLSQFKILITQMKGKTYQVALGGRGDVNKHEDFEEIVSCCREYDIVPNYTTSGLGLTDKEVEITKKYCGAVAVSFYRADYTYKAIEKYINEGIKTNIHYVLGKNSIDEAISYLKEEIKLQEELAKIETSDSTNKELEKEVVQGAYSGKVLPRGVNAVIFLLHKPVGLGSQENVLTTDDIRVKQFYKLVEESNFGFKVGFDSCNVPGLLNYTTEFERSSFDTCEAGRWSSYITSDMKLLPCSFDNQELKWAVDLNEYSIEQAWNSDKFESFRRHFKNSCKSCKVKGECLGGCPIRREIVLCDKVEKDFQ